MKKIQNVMVLALIAIGLSFFYACDKEECHDAIPVPEEEVFGEDLSTFIFEDNASIGEMFEGSPVELIGYLDPEERLVYVDFQHYETVQAELGAEGFEEVWFVPNEVTGEATPYLVQPIEALDLAAVPKPRAKFTIKQAKCITLKKADGTCYDYQDPKTGKWHSLKLDEDVKICEITESASDVCTFNKYNAAKVTSYPKRGCQGQGQAATANFPDC